MSTRLQPEAPPARPSLRLSDLAEIVDMLRMGADRVIWMLEDDGYMIVDRSDLSDLEAFLSGRTKKLSFSGDLLPKGYCDTAGEVAR